MATLDQTSFSGGTTSGTTPLVYYGSVPSYSDGSVVVSDAVSGIDTTVTATFSTTGANDAYNWTEWYYQGYAASTGYDDNDSVATWSFSNAVENLQFEIVDVDTDQNTGAETWDDRVILEIRDESGNLVPASDVIAALSGLSHHTFTALPDGTVQIDGSGDTGYFDADNVTIDFSGTGILVGFVGVTFTGGDLHPGFGFLGVTDFNFDVVCFAKGTLIETPNGEVPIESLQVGDEVKTLDHGTQEIRWIGGKHLPHNVLAKKQKLRPICIKRNTLGRGMPRRDLTVSPQHRILVKSKIANRMFDQDEVLVPAIKLLPIDGVEVDDHAQEVSYYHILLDNHELVWANGSVAETLYTGKEALKALDDQGRDEILELFPEVFDVCLPLARKSPKGRFVKKMIERHLRNNKDLYQLH